MAPAGVLLPDSVDVDVGRIEAPVTIKAYLMCAFSAFGGIFFGYDIGYINGILGMNYFVQEFGDGQQAIPAGMKSLIVSILSAGTFLGACKPMSMYLI